MSKSTGTDFSLGGAQSGAVAQGSVVDEELRALCGISSAFPADFKTPIALGNTLSGFRHRYTDKVLEIVAMKQAA